MNNTFVSSNNIIKHVSKEIKEVKDSYTRHDVLQLVIQFLFSIVNATQTYIVNANIEYFAKNEYDSNFLSFYANNSLWRDLWFAFSASSSSYLVHFVNHPLLLVAIFGLCNAINVPIMYYSYEHKNYIIFQSSQFLYKFGIAVRDNGRALARSYAGVETKESSRIFILKLHIRKICYTGIDAIGTAVSGYLYNWCGGLSKLYQYITIGLASFSVFNVCGIYYQFYSEEKFELKEDKKGTNIFSRLISYIEDSLNLSTIGKYALVCNFFLWPLFAVERNLFLLMLKSSVDIPEASYMYIKGQLKVMVLCFQVLLTSLFHLLSISPTYQLIFSHFIGVCFMSSYCLGYYKVGYVLCYLFKIYNVQAYNGVVYGLAKNKSEMAKYNSFYILTVYPAIALGQSILHQFEQTVGLEIWCMIAAINWAIWSYYMFTQVGPGILKIEAERVSSKEETMKEKN